MKKLLSIVILCALLAVCASGIKAQTAKEIWDEGFKADVKGDYMLAFEKYGKAISMEPTGGRYYTRALLYERVGAFDKALLDFEKGVQLSPEKEEIWGERGKLYMELGRYPEALADLKKAEELHPVTEGLYSADLAKAYVLTGNYEDAIRFTSQKISASATCWGEMLLTRAHANIELGYVAPAEKDIRFVKQNEACMQTHFFGSEFPTGNKLQLHRVQGLVYEKKQLYDLALREYDLKGGICDGCAEYHFARGNVLKQLGRIPSAKSEFELAIANAPHNEFYRSALANLAPPPKPMPQTWIVSVGVSSYYLDFQWSKLLLADDRAREFVDIFKDGEGVDAEHVRVLTDEQAGYARVLDTLRSFFLDNRRIKPEDLVVFFFSGHGMMMDTTAGICPYDMDSQNPARLISERKLMEILQACPAKQKLCILEACKNENTTLGRMPSPQEIERLKASRQQADVGIGFLTATKPGNYSYYTQDFGGVFSYYLLIGLKGAGDTNHDRMITVNEAFEFAKEGVGTYTQHTQIPEVVGSLGIRDVPIVILPGE